MPSFDAVSELDTHELTNAVDQANRELSQRFDFKDTGAEFELKEKEMTVSLKAPAEFQLKQMVDILAQRLSKRGIDVRCMEKKDAVTNLAEARQDIVLRHGIDADAGPQAAEAGQGIEAQGAGLDPGRQAARDREIARRPAGRHGAAAQGGGWTARCSSTIFAIEPASTTVHGRERIYFVQLSAESTMKVIPERNERQR